MKTEFYVIVKRYKSLIALKLAEMETVSNCTNVDCSALSVVRFRVLLRPCVLVHMSKSNIHLGTKSIIYYTVFVKPRLHDATCCQTGC